MSTNLRVLQKGMIQIYNVWKILGVMKGLNSTWFLNTPQMKCSKMYKNYAQDAKMHIAVIICTLNIHIMYIYVHICIHVYILNALQKKMAN